MEVKTYRARSVQQALALVRSDLGPDAAVLHTREVRRGWWSWLAGHSDIEVVASTQVHVPSRLPPPASAAQPPAQFPLASPRAATNFQHAAQPTSAPAVAATSATNAPSSLLETSTMVRGARTSRPETLDPLQSQLDQLQSMVQQLYQQRQRQGEQEMPATLFQLFTDLLDVEVGEDQARELIQRLRATAAPDDLEDYATLRARLLRGLEEELQICGPIEIDANQRKLVALVGPTGVGKTTTIAKLAADFHLRQQRRVGLITVDTYRIAAVEQLRTYADIIDLPMEVVSTPREMREAVERMSELDLILMDTAGRSPRDEVKIQELKTMLAEAEADEVHLVLSSVASLSSLKKTVQKFAEIGATAMIFTKLDEASGLGNLLPIVRGCRLPLSYLTNGQNVPDDIAPANRRAVARLILGCGNPTAATRGEQ